MTDWGASGRRDTYWAELVDPFTLDATGTIDIEDGKCSITYGYYTDHVYSASVPAVEGYVAGSMIRLWHRVQVDDYDGSYPMATLFVDDRPSKSIFGRQDTSLSCYSPLYRFSKDCFTGDYKVAKNTVISTAIKKLVEQRWGIIDIDDNVSTKATGKDNSFECGSVMLNALNDMCGWCGAELLPDGWGHLRLQPYHEPKDKQPVFRFDATNSMYVSGYSRDDGFGDSYNRAMVFYSVSNGSPTTRRSVKDLPDTHPFSREHLGMFRTIVTKLTDRVYTQAELDKMASQLLANNAAGEDYIEIEHVGIPGINVGDVVEYENLVDGAQPIDVRCIITEMNVSLNPGCMTKTKMRVIA